MPGLVKKWIASPLFKGVLAQVLSVPLVFGVALLLPQIWAPPYPLWMFVLLQGLFAAFFSQLLRTNSWWFWIHLLFPLALWLAWQLRGQMWWLLVFVLLLLVFWNVVIDRVPLYLSNTTTQAAVGEILRQKGAKRVVDLGSGWGQMLCSLQKQPGLVVFGVENAPVSYWISRWRCRGLGVVIWRQNLWQVDLRELDAVYAFLSPEPMAHLYEKLLQEMRSGSWLISNSFAVPGVIPTEEVMLEDGRQTHLYLYQIPHNV